MFAVDGAEFCNRIRYAAYVTQRHVHSVTLQVPWPALTAQAIDSFFPHCSTHTHVKMALTIYSHCAAEVAVKAME